jgi:hypothetical protein
MPTTSQVNILNEEFVFILERQESVLESKKTDTDDYVLEGIAAVFGKENNNNRIYEENEYLPHLQYLKEKISQKRLVGELDHPEKFDVSLKNISHIITELNHDKSSRQIKIKLRLLDTPAGQIAKKLVDAGVPLSISSRAAGNVGNDKKVQIKKIFTYDLVADPGFQDAQLERVYESAGYTNEEFNTIRNNSVINDLACINESLGLKKEDSIKIYRVENNEEFNKLVETTEKNKTAFLMEKEFVTAEELNKYTIFLKKELDSMKSAISEFQQEKQRIQESSGSDVSAEQYSTLEDRISKLEKYSEYLADNLDNSIKYGEYLAENLDQSISYSKYLAENLDKNISYSKYLAENIDKGISYTEYVAESVDKNIEYTKYVAEKLDDNIQYSEYLAENLDKGISYTEYIAENLDKGIAYTEYVAEKLNSGIEYTEYLAENLDKNINYSEYLAENLNKNIEYSDYLAENLNNGLEYSEYLAEKVKRGIAYSEYIAENVNAGVPSKPKYSRDEVDLSSNAGLNESGFAGDYDGISSKIDMLIESVKTQKTESIINEAAKAVNPDKTKKTEEVLNEADEAKGTGLKFIDEMPEEFAPIWESLSEGVKQSIFAQSNFYRLETPYQIKNFWQTRQLGSKSIGVQKLNENEDSAEQENVKSGYSSDYMKYIASQLEQKFQKR